MLVKLNLMPRRHYAHSQAGRLARHACGTSASYDQALAFLQGESEYGCPWG